MWLLHLLPDNFILYAVYFLLGVGALGIIVTSFMRGSAFINIYRIPLQLLFIAIFCAGIYWYGGYSTEMLWRSEVAKMKEQVEASEKKSKETNKKIQIKIVEKTKIVREKGKLQIEYVNRLVKGDTVEIVKDMTEQQKQEFLVKQKELQDALKNCPVPRIIVEEHNKAVESK